MKARTIVQLLSRIHRRLGIKYRFDRCRHYVRRFGLRGAIETHRRIWSATGDICAIEVPGIAHPIAIRAGTADASTLEKIFVWNEYDLPYPESVRTIIDAGANTGMAAVFFAERFPEATIVAIEPESRNFEILQRNVAPYPRIVPVYAALWSSDTTLTLSNPEDRVDSYRFHAQVGMHGVHAFSVPTLLVTYGLTGVDVLKVDIEGGEHEVFASSEGWIDRVRMFIVELHGAQCRETFLAATAQLHAERYHAGENEIVARDRSVEMKEFPSIVVLTPLKNDEWILQRFLEVCSLFADHIIIADQGSTDGGVRICAGFPKVTVIDNAASVYDEASRQRLLIDRAQRWCPCRGF